MCDLFSWGILRDRAAAKRIGKEAPRKMKSSADAFKWVNKAAEVTQHLFS